jgi:hypothetical protein
LLRLEQVSVVWTSLFAPDQNLIYKGTINLPPASSSNKALLFVTYDSQNNPAFSTLRKLIRPSSDSFDMPNQGDLRQQPWKQWYGAVDKVATEAALSILPIFLAGNGNNGSDHLKFAVFTASSPTAAAAKEKSDTVTTA